MWICNPSQIATESEYAADVAAELARRSAQAAIQDARQNETQIELGVMRMQYTLEDAAVDVRSGIRPDFITSPDGGVPFYAAAQVSLDYCQRIACGEITQEEAGPEAVYACSLAYGSMLTPNCGPRQPIVEEIPYQPMPSPAIQQRPNDSTQPLTPQNLALPIPDITQAFTNITNSELEPSAWCKLNQAIAANPFTAVVALVGLFAFLKGRK